MDNIHRNVGGISLEKSPIVDWIPIQCTHLWQDITTTITSIQQKCSICWAERTLSLN